jgi:HAD domain in Swiss Army Knife RNA repair proteins
MTEATSGATWTPNKVESLSNMDAVLFLDVDGVLHHAQPRSQAQMFRKQCMDLLREVLEETGAKIVLSTSWRLTENGRATVAAELAKNGCPQFVSRTPSLAQFQRPKEILAWVTKYEPKAWVAVDDWPLHTEPLMGGHFVQTRNRVGLEPSTIARIKELFRDQGQAGQPSKHVVDRSESIAARRQDIFNAAATKPAKAVVAPGPSPASIPSQPVLSAQQQPPRQPSTGIGQPSRRLPPPTPQQPPQEELGLVRSMHRTQGFAKAFARADATTEMTTEMAGAAVVRPVKSPSYAYAPGGAQLPVRAVAQLPARTGARGGRLASTISC